MANISITHDIVSINNNNPFQGERMTVSTSSVQETSTTTSTPVVSTTPIKKAKAPKTAKPETAKVEVVKAPKPSLDIKTLKLPKSITLTEMKSCIVLKNAKNNKWYIKGNRTLEINSAIPALEDRIEKFSPKIIANCHLGNSIGTIKLVDNSDLESILKHFASTEAISRTAKVEEKKPAKKAKAKAKTAKIPATTPVQEIPSTPELPTVTEEMITPLAA